MRKRLSILIALAAASMIAVATVMPAFASPSYVNLAAGSCYGNGQSWLSYPGGYTETVGCGASSQYLSATIILADGYDSYLSGSWQPYDQYFGNTGTSPHGAATTAAATHNLAFAGSQNGYVGTNTW